jgi:acylphosphatase
MVTQCGPGGKVAASFNSSSSGIRQISRILNGRIGRRRNDRRGAEHPNERAGVLLQNLAGDVLGRIAAAVIAGIEWAGLASTRSRGLARRMAMSQQKAISATVTGDDQKVGFRAMVMKQAIEYNLAGVAKNEPNMIVRFTLQGDGKRIDKAIAAINEGTKRSTGVRVSASPAAIEPGLKTFTIVDWTSSSRQIANPYTLIFTLRTDDGVISPDDAKTVWHGILEETLKGEDLKKLGAGD